MYVCAEVEDMYLREGGSPQAEVMGLCDPPDLGVGN